jgi:hypothetical protein
MSDGIDPDDAPELWWHWPRRPDGASAGKSCGR